jgi:hypothetical protein
MTDSPSAATNFANTVALLLTEPPPRSRPPQRLKNRGTSPIDQALMAFDVAVEFVTAADHFATVADWKQRQWRLKSWQETLSAEAAPPTLDELAAAAVAAGRLDRDEVDTVLTGTRYWEALLDDLAEILARRSRRFGQTEHMHRVVGAGCQRVATILKRCAERRAETSAAVEAQLSRISPKDTRARQSVIAKGRSDLMVVGDTTCEHVNAQTRRVLDLDERTAAMSVAHFWASNKHIIATS